ncbi:hypothetical protein [Pararcticibacter amylolyticus]|nr:hypothetical protein [Pararcticibacter amylolyticus]
MQTVLIPTDFSVSALDCIPSLCARFEGKDLTVVFTHMFKLSDSETELLLLSRRSSEFELVSDDFYRRCREIKLICPSVKSIKIEFFYGSTLSMLRNFIERNDVNYILNPLSCSVKKIHKYSIDPSVLLQKSGVPVIDVAGRATKGGVAQERKSVVNGNVFAEV